MKNKNTKYGLQVPSQTDNLDIIRDFVRAVSTKVGFQDEESDKIELAVDEACTNVIEHAYKFNDAKSIDIVIKIDYKKFSVIVSDQGKKFNPDEVELPKMKDYLAQLKVGGLGIYLMKNLMDEVN